MSPQQLIEAIVTALDQVSSIHEAESLIADERERNPELSDELSDLLEQFREEFEKNQAPTNLDYSLINDSSLTIPVPKQIGPYEIGSRLGQGGFGQVFVAKQSEPVERRVAVKLIRPEKSTPQIVSRFKHERQAMAEMNHPNIAKIFDGGVTQDGRPYFVMELVNGLAINKFVDRRNLDILQRLNLFLDVCRGVQHAHQKGVIHRDLKPSNIIVGEADGETRVKIIDFGVAKIIRDEKTDETNITKISQMIGTPRYMSPEQAALDNSEIDARSDIYSLGVILYELLTGETPITQERLDGASFDGVRQMICEEDPAKPSDRISKNANHSTLHQSSESASRRNRMVRGDLDWIVMKALEKEPRRRYESVNTMADDIVRFLNDEPIVARPPSKLYRTKKFIAKNRVLCLAATIVFLTMSVATALSTYYAIAATNAAEAERTAKANETNLRIFAEAKAGEAELSRKNEAVKRKQAEDIRDTLAAILKSPGPMGGGANVTIKQVLIDSIEDIRTKFNNDAETKFLLMRTIGETLFELGNYESSTAAFKGALETKLSDEYLRQWFETRINYARSLEAVRRTADAWQIAKKIVEDATETFGDSDLITLNAQFVLVDCHIHRGQRKTAMELAEKVFTQFERHFDSNSKEFLDAEIMLGQTYISNELYRKAINIFEKSIKKYETIYGVEDFRTRMAKSYMAQGLATGTTREQLEGKALIEDYLELVGNVIDDKHPEILFNKSMLSRIHAAQGDIQSAINVQKDVVDTTTKNFGEKSFLALQMRVELARYYRVNGNYDLATKQLDKIAKHPNASRVQSSIDFNRAEIMMLNGKIKQAKSYLIDVLDKVPSDAQLDSMVILMQRQLALAHFKLKEDQKSLELFTDVLRDLIEYSGEFHPKVPLVYKYIALLHERGGRVGKALENYDKAIMVSSQLIGEGSARTIELINLKGMCYLTGRQMKEHVETIKKAVSLAEENLDENSLTKQRVRFNLAALYRNQKKYEQATPLLKKVLESQSLMTEPESRHEVFDFATNEMACNYMFRRDEEKAEVWFPKYFEIVKKQFKDDPNYYASSLVHLTAELNRYGIYNVSEDALEESLEIRSNIMPESWLLDNTRSILAETRFLRAKRDAGPSGIDSSATKEIETLLLDSFQAMESKLDSIPTRYRKSRLTSAAQRLVAYYEAASDDESKSRWVEKISEIKTAD